MTNVTLDPDLARSLTEGVLGTFPMPATGAPAQQPAVTELPPPQPPAPPQPATQPAQPPAPVAAQPEPPRPPPPRVFDASSVADRFTRPVAELTATPPPAAAQPPAAPSPVPEAPPAEAGHKPDERQAYTWAKLRSERNAFEADLRTERQKLAEFEAEKQKLAEEKAALAEEVQKAKRETETLSETVGKLNLAESPQFKQKYGQKAAEIESKLASHLTRFARVPQEDAVKKARELIAMDPSDLSDATAEMHPSVAGMVLTLAGDMAALSESRDQELANWRSVAANMGVQEARETVVRSAEQRLALANDALEAAVATGNPVYTATDPQAKEVSASLVEAFKGFAQTATDDQLMRAAAEGFTTSYLVDALNQQAEEIGQLRDMLASRDRASMPPMFAAAGGYTPPAAPPAPTASKATSADSPEAFARASAEGAVAALHNNVWNANR